MLSDLELLSGYLKEDRTHQDDIDEYMSVWNLRHQAIQPSFQAKEANLSLCRVTVPLFRYLLSIAEGKQIINLEPHLFCRELALVSSRHLYRSPSRFVSENC